MTPKEAAKLIATYFDVELDGKPVLKNAENLLQELEVERHFYRFVSAAHPATLSFGANYFFRGNHRERPRTGRLKYINFANVYVTNRTTMAVQDSQRFRATASRTALAPAEPNQIAFCLGSLNTSFNFIPEQLLSTRDIGVGLVGTVFAHPIGRLAYFNETAVVANGVGQVNTGGSFAPPSDEQGHFLYDLRVGEGDVGPGFAAAKYFFRKRPYFRGCYEVASGKQDYLGTHTSYTFFSNGSDLGHQILNRVVETVPAPTPGNVPQSQNYPTLASRTISVFSYTTGMALDTVGDDSRIWWTISESDRDGNEDDRLRALWSWRRMTPDLAARADAQDVLDAPLGDEEQEVLTDWPAFAVGCRYNSIKAARGGWMFVAVDGDDDAGTGADNGALVMFDAKRLESVAGATKTITAASGNLFDANASFPTYIAGRKILILDAANPANNGLFNVDSRTDANNIVLNGGSMAVDETTDLRWILVEGVQRVIGAAAGGIYTDGGLLENNAIGITIDQTEARAGVGKDRIWVMSRDGLAYADLTVADGTLSAWTTITEAGGGGGHTTLAAQSQRGYARFHPGGLNGGVGTHGSLIDHDSAGDVYWGSFVSGNFRRLNKVLGGSGGPGHTHTFYTLDDATTEGGALGRIELGDNANSNRMISLYVQRRDAGDPKDDTVWITGMASTSTVGHAVAALSITDFDAGGTDPHINGTNDSMGWAASHIWGADASLYAHFVHVAPDGQAVLVNWDNPRNAVLESLGESNSQEGSNSVTSGTGDQIEANTPAAGQMRVTQAGTTFLPNLVGKWFRVENAANAGNDGLRKVLSVPSTSQIVLDDSILSSAVNEGPAATFTWDLPGTDFVEAVAGNFFNEDARHNLVNFFFDGTGIGWCPPWQINSGNGNIELESGMMSFQMPICYQWDGGGTQWYRSLVQVVEDAATKAMHAGQEALDANSGITIGFNDPGGTPVFEKGEYYTFLATVGVAKDAVQEITFSGKGYRLTTQKIVAEARTQRTAQHHTPICARQNSIPDAPNDDTFAASGMSAVEQRQLGHYQRTLWHDGANGTTDLAAVITYNTTTGGSQIALDLGSDQQVSTLALCFFQGGDNQWWGQCQLELYSSADAGGVTPWTLRATYRPDQDHPEWILQTNALHLFNGATYGPAQGGSGAYNTAEFFIDLDALETAAKLASPATNDPQRYWKVVLKQHTGSRSVTVEWVGLSAYNTSGVIIGYPSDLKLGTADDSNYLANYILRSTWIEDEGTGTTATSGDGLNVTLAADTFELAEQDTGAVVTITQDTPIAGTARLDDATANFATTVVGRYILISNAANAANNGLKLITARNSATQIEYTDAGAITEATALNWLIDGVAVGDFYRRLDASNNVVAEGVIDNINSNTDIDLGKNVGTFAGEDWEVVRDAGAHPVDGNFVNQFPDGAGGAPGDLWVDWKGHIYCHPDDVLQARKFQIDEYVKIQRGR
jgi:hypothetical protein